MAVVESTMLALKTRLPEFVLSAVNGEVVDSSKLALSRGLLVSVICNHCPYVVHIKDRFVSLSNQWINSGLDVVAISANDPSIVPEDSPEAMRAFASENGIRFPYLYDETQQVVKLFKAVCTPEFYLFNSKRELIYRGQFDDSRPGNTEAVTGELLASAVEALLSDKESDIGEQKPSMGCNIKWRNGNWPDYCS